MTQKYWSNAIINCTIISCYGHPLCPQDITTPDNTKSYIITIITNLLPGTDYTFTVKWRQPAETYTA